jgi:uncharacterized protein
VTPGRTRLAFLAVVALLATAGAAPVVPPAPTRYATDLTGVIDPARLDALDERLAAFERETSNQVVVYVDRKLPAGATLEEWSTAALNAWGIGQDDKDNGVGLLVFIDDRRLRIEVGYGLEKAISNDEAGRIIEEAIKPHFKAGDYTAGVEAGADAIMKAARTAGYRGTGKTRAEKKPVP